MNGPLPKEGSQAPKGPTGRTAMGETQTPGRLACALGVKGFLEEAVGSKEPEGSGPGEKDQNVRRSVTRDPTQPLCSPSLLSSPDQGLQGAQNLFSSTHPRWCVSLIQLHPPTVVCTPHPAVQLQMAQLMTRSTPDLTTPISATTESSLCPPLTSFLGKKTCQVRKRLSRRKGG